LLRLLRRPLALGRLTARLLLLLLGLLRPLLLGTAGFLHSLT